MLASFLAGAVADRQTTMTVTLSDACCSSALETCISYLSFSKMHNIPANQSPCRLMNLLRQVASLHHSNQVSEAFEQTISTSLAAIDECLAWYACSWLWGYRLVILVTHMKLRKSILGKGSVFLPGAQRTLRDRCRCSVGWFWQAQWFARLCRDPRGHQWLVQWTRLLPWGFARWLLALHRQDEVEICNVICVPVVL